MVNRIPCGVQSVSLTHLLIACLYLSAISGLGTTRSLAQAPLQLPAGSTEQRPSMITPIAVFGRDDRLALPAGFAHLRNSIGLVSDARTENLCTGFCVADRVIATAAHCLFPTTGERHPDLHGFQFTLAATPDQHASPIAGAKSRRPDPYVIAGSRDLRVEPPIDAARDWALIRLEKPICSGATIPVAAVPPRQVEQQAKAGRLIQIAFHNDYRNLHLAYSQPCSAKAAVDTLEHARVMQDFNDAGALILHNCDSGGTSSGSPLLVRGEDGRLSAAAINVGTYVQTRMLVDRGRIVRRYRSNAIANTAVSATAFAGLIERFATARIVGAKPELRALQRHLRRLGHYHASVDGIFGPHTRQAIQAYRGDYRSVLAGLPTRELLRELQSQRHGSTGTGTRTSAIIRGFHHR